ncbi:MAG TPA: lysophospholipid acyltransferase family protein [Armatimonadota bacterium]|nr:lysophospholipid acyltransferase family protein [Armatimonadota bacterium]
MIYRIVWSFCRLAFATLFRWQVRGAEHVPAHGAVILASNHISNLDPPVVGVGVWRPCTFMAKEELFHNRFFGGFIRRLGAFPVKRGAGDRAALKKALELLEEEHALVMFPEGTRSETGELQQAEMGVGMIACRSGAPVVPVYVTGTNRVMPKSGGLHLARICVTYGPPLRFEPPAGSKPGREEYESAAREIMAAIAALRDGSSQ